MKRPLAVVIVGGGMTGLAAAARLARGAHAAALRITLVDAAARPVFDARDDVHLRVSAVSLGSASLLDCIGAWPIVEQERYCPYDHMRVWDAADVPDGPSTLRFDADEFATSHLGSIVENVLVQHALLEVLRDTDVELRFSTRIESIVAADNGHRIELDDGNALQADLVIAADGGRSRVREALGIDVKSLAYDQAAFVTHVRPERPHAATAWQRFLPDGPLGLLPLADGRLSIVWSTTNEKARAALDADDAGLGAMLTAASDRVLGELVPAGERGSFPLLAQHANEYVRHGVALIGDAAHTIHPLAGQGANLGFADVGELANVIEAALAAGEYPADRPVLRRYERARRGENAVVMHAMTGLNRLFASDSQALGKLRRAGMQLFNASGPIRKRVVGVALGSGR
ncbi:MAG: FAD-dependent monooxygenase [Woeseiaceae bacterium]|nr:FAD-dependent monooxygenase [Woeseiaceae bacterium]